MTHVRSNIVQKLVRLHKYLRSFGGEDSFVKYVLSSVINLRLLGSRIEKFLTAHAPSPAINLRLLGSYIEKFLIGSGEKLASFFSKLQRSTEESLFMSSMYMGLLLTMVLTAMVVLMYALR